MPISPNQGTAGTLVTVTGVNLANALSVAFGQNQATITANTPTMVSVIAPSGCGVADVTVTTPGGTSNFLYFFYIPPPLVDALSGEFGPTSGGNSINIIGYNLATATSVNFGSNSATPTIINDGMISVVVPAGTGPGSIYVYVMTAGGTSASHSYSYVDAPTISMISPGSGPTSGGTSVTITGTDLASATSVTFAGTPCSFGAINSTTIAAITPPGSAGAVDVVVTTEAGSATLVSGYVYISGPGI
jgi:hypothetical protein